MINYSGIDVKSMTEDQMKSLIGMKFSENPPKAPDSNVREEGHLFIMIRLFVLLFR
jgi:hypothetical protein